MTHKLLTAATALALLVAGAAAPALARPKKEEAAKGPKLTPAVQKALVAAQTAATANDIPTATAQLREADAVPGRTSEDNFYISQIKIRVGQASKDNAMLKDGLEQAVASGQASPEQLISFQQVLGDLAVNAKDYATAYKYYNAVAVLKPNDPALATNIAKLAYDNRAMPARDRIAALQKAVTVAEAAGTKPDSFLYEAQVQIAADAKLPDADTPTLALVRAYPSPKNWETASYIFRRLNPKLDYDSDIDVYRLQRATGSLTGGGQYLDYAQLAQQRGLPGESSLVLKEGQAKGVVQTTTQGYTEIARANTPAKLAGDKASLPGLETKAKASATGRLADATADGYLSYGQYAKAAELYRAALAKGGIVSADRTNTRLGYALAMSGDKTGAEAAFKAVGGEPRATLAKYWLVWLAQKA